jgi:hypothetical protein
VRGPGSAGEQVGLAAFELAGTAPGEQEPQSTILDEPVHLIQESGKLLDLIDHDPRAGPSPIADERLQQARLGRQPEVKIRSQEVEQVGQRDQSLEIQQRYC